MKVGDLVRLSESSSNFTARDWGIGLIEKVHTEYFSADILWLQKSRRGSGIPWSHLEVVSESR